MQHFRCAGYWRPWPSGNVLSACRREGWLCGQRCMDGGPGTVARRRGLSRRRRAASSACVGRCAAAQTPPCQMISLPVPHARRRTWCVPASTCPQWQTARRRRRWRGSAPMSPSCQTATKHWWGRGNECRPRQGEARGAWRGSPWRQPRSAPAGPQVGEASRVELGPMARLRLGIARLLLLRAPLLVLIDDADRFATAVPRFPGAVAGAPASVQLVHPPPVCPLASPLPAAPRPLPCPRGAVSPAGSGRRRRADGKRQQRGDAASGAAWRCADAAARRCSLAPAGIGRGR